MSAFHFFLSVVGAAIFLSASAVGQTQDVAAIALFSATAAEHQTPAVGSGKFDKKGWPKPRWWKKYRLRFGKKGLKKCKFLGNSWPQTGESCPTEDKDYVCLMGDAFCCDAGCEPAYRCDCINEVFQCTHNTSPNPCVIDSSASVDPDVTVSVSTLPAPTYSYSMTTPVAAVISAPVTAEPLAPITASPTLPTETPTKTVVEVPGTPILNTITPPTRVPTVPPTRIPTEPPTRVPTNPPTPFPTNPPTPFPTEPPVPFPTDPPSQASIPDIAIIQVPPTPAPVAAGAASPTSPVATPTDAAIPDPLTLTPTPAPVAAGASSPTSPVATPTDAVIPDPLTLAFPFLTAPPVEVALARVPLDVSPVGSPNHSPVGV